MKFHLLRVALPVPRLLAVAAAVAVLAGTLPWASSQTTSSVVLTDAGTGNGATIDGMELRGAGLYWWKYGASGEVGGYAPTLGIKPALSKYALNLDRTGPYYMLNGGSFIAGAERDGIYAYFTANRGGGQVGLFRQLLSSAVNATPQRLAGIVAPEVSTGAIGRFGSDLFFAPTYANGYTPIWRVSFNSDGLYTGAGVAAEGFLNPYPVRKIQFLNATINGVTGTYGVCLQADTTLWRFGPLEGPSLQPMVYLGAGVGDMAVRRDDGGNAFNGLHDKIYATTSPVTGGPVGKLLIINPTNGAATEVYADPGGQKFLAFGFDNNFLFLSRTNSPSGEILRKFVPYLSYLTNPVPGQPTGWVTIETASGTNLRSDGRWLYFTRGNQIRRVGTAVPGISLDFQAFGIEAVQICQDLNNSWPLIEGKPVLVRCYARVAANSDVTKPTRQPPARLAAFQNGAAGKIYYPLNSPAIGNEPATSLALYRTNSTATPAVPDNTQSFDFMIPAADVLRGTMQFQFTVNEPRSMIEIGVANAYGNNTATTPVMQVVATAAPTLVFMPIQTQAPLYDLTTDPAAFWQQIARARTLLPVPEIRVKTAPLVISRAVVRYDPPRTVLRDFDFPDQQDDALTRLLWLSITRGVLVGNAIGMVHPAIDGFNGLGYVGLPALLAKMRNDSAGSNGWDAPWGGRTLAHEMGHNYGRAHVNFTSGSEAPKNPDANYPGNPANISGVAGAGNNNLAASVFGWDPISGQFIDGSVIPDLMSYGSSRWLSRYTRNAIVTASPAASLNAPTPAALAEGDVFLISGSVRFTDALASLDPAQAVPDGTYDPAAVAASIAAAALPPGHDYLVRQLDAAGAFLGESPVVLRRTGDGWLEENGFTQFVVALPGVAFLQIAKGATVLAQLNGQGASPVVAVDPPVLEAEGQVLRGTWSATDADGTSLFSTVHFSSDGGVSWQPVERMTANSSVAVSVAKLPGGADCRLRVIVTDGFNTTIGQSAPFSLPAHAPEITVIGVKPGEKLNFGSKATLTAFAMDTEEGSLPGSGISWVLSGPQPMAQGGDTLYLEGLPPGAYTAVASATDASGTPGSKNLSFEIRPIPLTAGVAPGLNGEVDDAAYLSAALVQWAAGSSRRVSARILRSGGRLYLGFSELPYRSSTANPMARVGVRIDVDGSADAAVQSSDLGFFLDEDGRPVQMEGNGSTMVVSAAPAGGYDSALNSGETAWTAEIALPESVLGGAGHEMRVMFTMELPQAGGGSLLYRWPPVADTNSPATWAPVQLGALPPPVNAPPVAHPGGDRVVDPTETVSITLDGSGSVDPEGLPLTYQWQQTAGTPVILTGENSAQPSFAVEPVSSTAVLRFALVVNDGEFDSPPAEVSVTVMSVVPPTPPIDIPRFTRFPDGTIQGYFSSFDLSPPAADPTPNNFNPVTQGVYAIETSEDLENWTSRFGASPDLLGRLIFNDLSATELPRRFYRAGLLGAAGVLSPGTALQFDGAVRWVSVPHSTAFNTYPLTVSAWIKTANTSNTVGGIVSKYADGSVNGWSLFTYAGHVRGFYFAGGSREVWGGGLGLDGGFIADDQWHHVVMTIGPAGGIMYVDGTALGSLPWTGTPAPTSTTQPLQIGRYHTYPNSISGVIDEASVWSVELSGLQVLDLRRRAPVGTETGLQALWTLDDGAGTTATDTTANSHHGTLLGSPEWVPSTAPIRR